MVSDEFLREAIANVQMGIDANAKNWAELPKLLERSAADFALKANAATNSATKPVVDALAEIRDEQYKQSSLLAAMKEEVSQLARQSSFNTRDIKALKRDLVALKESVRNAEDRINLLEKVR